jgi:hypothetical protein
MEPSTATPYAPHEAGYHATGGREGDVEVRDHLVLVGSIVMNLQALETVLRYFLLRVSRQDPQFPTKGCNSALGGGPQIKEAY